jgi:hypothetical protein
MKPVPSPLLTAAIVAALALAASATSTLAQQQQTTTTVTEQTVVEKKVTTPPPKVTTELDFMPASTANDINVQMLRDFGNVKQSDPKVAIDIARNPQIVENTGYVGKHPSLQAFLAKYPAASNEIVSSPGNFVTPVAGSKWNSHEAAGIPRD